MLFNSLFKELLWQEIKSKHHNIAVHTFLRSLSYNIFLICLFQHGLIFQIEIHGNVFSAAPVTRGHQ